MNLPNLLTLLRIALLPLFIYFLAAGRYREALTVFFIGSISDAMDGFIARRFNQVTEIGKLLDPIADKIFLLSSFTAFYMLDILPLWFFLVAIIKDFTILGGIAFIQLKHKKLDIEPTFAGKTSTAFQMVTILLILLNGLGYVTNEVLIVAMVLTAAILFYSIFSYIIVGVRIYKGDKHFE